MANHVSHGALPYPIKNARFTLDVPYLDADGDPTDPTTPDTEASKDGGAYADCAEEVTTVSGSNGTGYITLTGAETNASLLHLCAKVASGPKATIGFVRPRVLALIGSGTLSAGSAGGGTLGTLLAYDVTGCFIRTTGGTGGGGTGGANNQARKIVTCNTGTGAFTVEPNWETTPDNTTTYDVLLPEGVTLGMLKALNPTTAGDTLTLTSNGVDVRKWLGGTIPAVNVTGVPLVDCKYLLGTIFSTPTVGGVPNVNAKTWNDLATVALPLVPTTAGRTLDVTAANKVNGVVLVDTLTTYTGNTLQTGDSFARIGAAGAGLTNIDLPNQTMDIVGNITGNLSGSVGSISGVTFPANFASLVIDATGRVNAFLIGILASVFTEGAAGRIAAAFKQFFNIATPAATMDHGVLVDTVTTTTTATNLTNAATNGDLTATMKASVNTEADTALSDVGVTGTVTGRIDATISSRTKPADTQAAVTLVATTTNLTNAPTAGDFTATMKTSLNAATPAVTVSDKTGFSLTSAYDPAKTASQAGDAMALTSGERTTLSATIWDRLTSAITTAGSIGKLIKDYLGGGSKVAATVATGDDADAATIKTRVLLALPNAAPAAAGGLPTLLNAGAPDGMSLAQVVNVAPTGLAAIGENVRDTNNLTPATDSLGEAVNNGIGGGGGGSGDWTVNEKTAIRSILGIPTSGTTPLVPSVGVMRRIYLKTDLIGTVGATVENDDLEAGQMELVVGDTYSQTLGNEKTFNSPAGYPDPTGRPVAIGVGRLDSDTDLFVETGRIVSWNSGTGVIVAAFPFSATSTNTLSHDVDAGTYGYGWQVEYATGERTGGLGEVKALRKWGN